METQQLPRGGDIRHEVLELFAKLREAARNPQRIEQITNELEVFTMAYVVPMVEDYFPGLHLTRIERRMLSCLRYHTGKVVSRDMLMNAMYFDRADDEPAEKIIDVKMNHLRKKLRGSRYDIKTAHGLGYELRIKDDAH